MAVKALRQTEVQLAGDSFGSWYDELCDGNPRTRGPLAAAYPTTEDQIELCWAVRLNGFDPYNPRGSRLLSCALADGEAMTRWIDEEEAWFFHDFPEDRVPSYIAEEMSEYEIDEYFDDLTPWATESALETRIAEAFPSWDPEPASKKRRVTDRKDRYERRDRSTRGHMPLYGLSHKAHIKSERASLRAALNYIKAGADADRIHLTGRSTA